MKSARRKRLARREELEAKIKESLNVAALVGVGGGNVADTRQTSEY